MSVALADGLAIEAADLLKSFKEGKGKPAVAGISLGIPLGQLTALVGPDGAGKTTLLRMVAGLMKPDAGTLVVLGINVKRDPQAVQDRISYMPQRFGLYEDLSVQENLDLYADLHGVPANVRRDRFERMLTMTDMARFTHRPAGKLSGGMKQKLGLACTLVRAPDLLLLDEPTVGVDPLSRRELWRIVQQLVDEERLSVIVSTGYMDEAERCEHVIVMNDGKMLAQGTPEALREPADRCCFVAHPPSGVLARTLQARLIDDRVNIVDAVPVGGAVRFIRAAQADDADIAALLGNERSEAVPACLEDGVMTLLHAQSAAAASSIFATPSTSVATTPEDGERPVLIEVRDLVRRFGDFVAVASTSFKVQRGEIFGLLGPNGAGKTTTFRMLCGLLPATSGFLEVAGYNLRTARAEARGRVGYVSQKFALYGNLSAVENLTFFGGAYGLQGAGLRQRIEQVLDEFDLATHQHSPSGELPGGFKQRLAMAAALLHQPDILFLDEPTSGIDPLARRAFWRRITALSEAGTTVVITTHFMEEAEYCDRIVIQDAGRLLAIGTPDEVRAQVPDAADMNTAFIGIVEQARSQKPTTEKAVA
ncbi:MAG: ATP-binding cassette domain-containing protein [Azonexus sp.]|jgi:ABC-2 type transport system ATP-binding protein|uniref:ATP-binding cassette domain-containing protein n=1 Tax=Azonexus sp. TaxID=1872668 RepID=UPI00282E6C95|nr:ATP-binding cassette domain-containing protein [Azonexus sp.]MDR0776413.1 ATP-binding cassette domain-containing protein [Azonexus sp.]